MRQRGRQGGELTVANRIELQERPAAPVELTPEQSDEWIKITNSLPADWFPAETHALLLQHCRHMIEARRLAQLIDQECSREETDVQAYIELLKAQGQETAKIKATSASLRLSPQSSRSDDTSKTAKKNRTIPTPWRG